MESSLEHEKISKFKANNKNSLRSIIKINNRLKLNLYVKF